MKRKSLQRALDLTSNKSRRLDVEVVGDVSSSCRDQSGVNLVDDWRDKVMVLYNPPDSPLSLLKTPALPELPTIVFDSQLIPGIRDHLYWPGMAKTTKAIEDNVDSDSNSEAPSNCFAVVPWVAPQPTIYTLSRQPTRSMDAMETEEVQADMMDIEEFSSSSNVDAAFNLSGMLQGKHERQQHFIEPQHFQNNSSTVYW